MDRKTKARLRDLADEIHRKAALARVEQSEDWRRDHLGASIMGQQCRRYVWLSFRWASDPRHDARMLRLFERGQLEEERFAKVLREAGLKFRAPDGTDEFRWSHKHLGGECDGIIDDFLGDGKPAIAEMKTHSLKSFRRLAEKKSVRACKREHWVQMQLYMLNLGMETALYCAVNKNDDELYFEIVTLDRKVATRVMDESLEMSMKDQPPEKMDEFLSPCVLISKEGQRYPCSYNQICHGKLTEVPERNCRTCMESTMTEDGGWHCGYHGRDLSSSDQRSGCPDHLYNPSMINAQIEGASKEDRWVDYVASDGTKFRDQREAGSGILKVAEKFNLKIEKGGRKW